MTDPTAAPAVPLPADVLAALNARFEDAAPQNILAWAVTQWPERLALVTSFQPSGLVILHMLREIAPDLPILTLDTGLLFPETLALIERWERDYSLTVRRVRPAQTVAEQAAAHGDALWSRTPDQCCDLRKTVPLGHALRPYAAWFTGVRRDQAETRRAAPVIAWDAKYASFRIAPLVTWTEDMAWTYIHAYGLPYNGLHEQGYPSIGCWPCTRAVAAGEDARAGRWQGQAKTECGIHLPGSDALLTTQTTTETGT